MVLGSLLGPYPLSGVQLSTLVGSFFLFSFLLLFAIDIVFVCSFVLIVCLCISLFVCLFVFGILLRLQKGDPGRGGAEVPPQPGEPGASNNRILV